MNATPRLYSTLFYLNELLHFNILAVLPGSETCEPVADPTFWQSFDVPRVWMVSYPAHASSGWPTSPRNLHIIYDVQARVKDKDVAYGVASDGKVLSAEESVPYASLPAVVRTAVERYFGSAEGLKTFKEVEGGKTFYEVEGKKGNTKIALKLDETGKILEEEKV